MFTIKAAAIILLKLLYLICFSFICQGTSAIIAELLILIRIPGCRGYPGLRKWEFLNGRLGCGLKRAVYLFTPICSSFVIAYLISFGLVVPFGFFQVTLLPACVPTFCPGYVPTSLWDLSQYGDEAVCYKETFSEWVARLGHDTYETSPIHWFIIEMLYWGYTTVLICRNRSRRCWYVLCSTRNIAQFSLIHQLVPHPTVRFLGMKTNVYVVQPHHGVRRVSATSTNVPSVSPLQIRNVWTTKHLESRPVSDTRRTALKPIPQQCRLLVRKRSGRNCISDQTAFPLSNDAWCLSLFIYESMALQEVVFLGRIGAVFAEKREVVIVEYRAVGIVAGYCFLADGAIL